MDASILIRKLAGHKTLFGELLGHREADEVRWRPAPGKWCLLEIVCHLLDEEVEDFRYRTRHCLHRQPVPPVPIDPEGWVKTRQYMAQDYREKVAAFLDERQRSVDWLRSLDKPDWQSASPHPRLGVQTASHYLTNWLAHDYLHIRQILRLDMARLEQSSGEDLSYAGNW